MSRKTPQADSAAATDELVGGFEVHLDNFEGPFDLLLKLISRHELDVTQVALSQVTDEFIAQVKAGGKVWDLEKTSSFLVVAATLLDLKTARLLPGGEATDPEDIAALEARDLLFARLLQYRAFKQLAAWVQQRMDDAAGVHYRPGGLEEQFMALLPEVELHITSEELAGLAAAALAPKPEPVVPLQHLHGVQVSVTEQVGLVSARLRQHGSATFRSLTKGQTRLVSVVRFLAVLELYRAGQVVLEQAGPLTELLIRWVGADEDLADVDEYDSQPQLEEQ